MSPDNDIERREKPSLYGVAGALLLSIITLTLLEDDSVLVSSIPMISTAFAQKENNIDNTAKVTSTTTNTSSVSSLHGIQFSALPVWKEQATNTGVAPINKTHTKITFIGNGTLTLPDTGKTIVVTNNGTLVGSSVTQSAYGRELSEHKMVKLQLSHSMKLCSLIL